MRLSDFRTIRRSKTLLEKIRKGGIKDAMRYACHRIAEHYGDWRLGIQTGRYVTKQELGYADTGLNLEYVATSYHGLRTCFDRVPIRPGQSVLVDYGCGMGRVVIFAARRNFRKVIGVEYTAQLAEVAKANVRRAEKRLKCPVEIVNADAQAFLLPPEVDVIFMYSPFRGSILANVVNNIRMSIKEHPRKIWIIYVPPGQFETLIQGEAWIEKIFEHYFYNRIRHCIYVCHENVSMPSE